MSDERFGHEVDMIAAVGRVGLAPRLLGVWTSRRGRAHYGFIAMERLEVSVKEIILRRDLSPDEMALAAKGAISRLHRAGFKHGDMKPSNIGARIGPDGRIASVCMIDWAKGGRGDDVSFRRDRENFLKHVRKNVGERRW